MEAEIGRQKGLGMEKYYWDFISRQFALPLQQTPEQLSPPVLAYIGDAVYELYIRSLVLSEGKVKVYDLHHSVTGYVRAASQAKIMHGITEMLTEAEMTVARRGRNAKTGHVPKNADMADYRYATGFETLVGYLFIRGEYVRLTEILERGQALLAESEPDSNED